jgi:hypothetical protein
MNDGNSHSFDDKTEQDLGPRNICQSTHKRQQQFPLAFSLILLLETKHGRIQSQIPPSKSRSEIWCSYCIVRTTKFEDYQVPILSIMKWWRAIASNAICKGNFISHGLSDRKQPGGIVGSWWLGCRSCKLNPSLDYETTPLLMLRASPRVLIQYMTLQNNFSHPS